MLECGNYRSRHHIEAYKIGSATGWGWTGSIGPCDSCGGDGFEFLEEPGQFFCWECALHWWAYAYDDGGRIQGVDVMIRRGVRS